MTSLYSDESAGQRYKQNYFKYDKNCPGNKYRNEGGDQFVLALGEHEA